MHMRVNSLPKAVTWKLTGRDSNPRSIVMVKFHRSDTDTDTDLSVRDASIV